MGWLARIVALSTALCVGGCGLMMTRGPDPRRPPDQRPTCTETYDAPKRDALGAVFGLIAVIIGGVYYDLGDNEDVGVPLLVIGGVTMAGSYASGGIGYFRVKRCRKAIAKFEARSGG